MKKEYYFVFHSLLWAGVFTYFITQTLNSTFSAPLLIAISLCISLYLSFRIFKTQIYQRYITHKFNIDSVCSFFLKFGFVALLAAPILHFNQLGSIGELQTIGATVIDKEYSGRYGTYKLKLKHKKETVSISVNKGFWESHKINSQLNLKIQRGLLGFYVIDKVV
ncbi:hypothetical protein CWB73_20365 [Pseudoalteromonas phenolica]|uniref:Uncharacterized protein n=1 Tax=Pseudoalteromonas phenolica TaxID=161398 RepID=A0A5S3YMK4_9GAMM|nr:hypothetical protein [Pseudoalteromonas phenolica]TMP77320.1 hypothetical protein CWB73_20365 [Pseudoalteromonas phenolica]